MPTEEEKLAQEGVAVIALRNELLDANFDGARVVERENMIPPQAIQSVVKSAFDTFIEGQKFSEAIELGKVYNLPKDKINDVIYMEFRRIIATGDIEKAIEWALKNNLPDYEITRAAVKGIEAAILAKDIELAVELKKRYSVTEEQIGSVWQRGYDEAIQDGKFFEAALLSREFGMSERKTIITAARAFRKAIQEEDFDRMIQVEDEFLIFKDSSFSLLGDEDGRSLIKGTEEFIKKKLRTDDFRRAVEVIHGLGILYKDIANHTLRDLVHFIYTQGVTMHQILLQENRYDDAVWFKNELNLLESNTPEKTLREVFNQAVTKHNSLLKEGKISLAIKVKQDYDLLGALSDADSIDLVQSVTVSFLTELIEKGDTKSGNLLIKEYSIPHDEIAQVANSAAINALNAGKYERAIDIVSKFHVDTDNFDFKTASREAFEKCRNSGYHETAANIGYIFGIDSPDVKDSARLIWEDLMRRQEYRKAAVIKRKHKLTRRHTGTVSKEEYDRLININEIDKAQEIRGEYRVNVGFLSWIIEFIKKILLIFFGGEKDVPSPPAEEAGDEGSPGDTPPEKTAHNSGSSD